VVEWEDNGDLILLAMGLGCMLHMTISTVLDSAFLQLRYTEYSDE
jgi:hypothetical protein